MTIRLFALAGALALSACVATPDTDSTSQELATCSSNLVVDPSQLMPGLVAWNGALPQSGAGTVWLVFPWTTDVNGWWVVYQVDTSQKKVMWGAYLPAGKRDGVYTQISAKVQPMGGIRVPPGPIGPGGSGWAQVNALVHAADIITTGY